MANRVVTGSTLGDGVTVTNSIDETTGAPSTVSSSVTISTTDSVTESGTGGYVGVNLGEGNNTLHAENMPWANSTSSNAFDYIRAGSGDDYISLDRSAVRNDLNTGAGNDTLDLNNSYARDVDMGTGDDEVTYSADNADVTNEELSAKDPNNPMTLDGGGGIDTLNLHGDWTLTLSSGDATIEEGGETIVTNTLTNEQMANVVSMPSLLNGTVSYGTVTLDNGDTIPSRLIFSNFEDINAVCFTAGTMVETPDGQVAIETLKVGDPVVTRHGVKPLKWIGKRRLDVIDLMANPKLLPIRIPAGAMGNDLPRRDISVSPQHRIMIRSAIAERMFAASEVLMPAKSLVGHNGVDVDGSVREVVYIHLMFDHHTTIDVEGIEAETLYLGPEALKMISPDGLQELVELFGDLEAIPEKDDLRQPCLPFVRGRKARALVARHAKNNQPFLS